MSSQKQVFLAVPQLQCDTVAVLVRGATVVKSHSQAQLVKLVKNEWGVNQVAVSPFLYFMSYLTSLAVKAAVCDLINFLNLDSS